MGKPSAKPPPSRLDNSERFEAEVRKLLGIPRDVPMEDFLEALAARGSNTVSWYYNRLNAILENSTALH